MQIGPACPKCRRALGTTVTLRDNHKCVNLGQETVNNDSFAHSNGLVPVPECYVQDLHMGISNGPAGPVNPVAAGGSDACELSPGPGEAPHASRTEGVKNRSDSGAGLSTAGT